MMKILITALIAMWCSTGLAAQERPLHFKHLTRDDGLSSNRINCILEDTYGFMWFGTENGLNRYDGYGFDVFQNDPGDSTSIQDNVINGILEDTLTKNMLLLTPSGLVSFDRATYRFSLIFKQLQEESITALCPDSNHRLVAGSRNGVFHLDLNTQQVLAHYPVTGITGEDQAHFYVSVMVPGPRGLIWIGYQEGVVIFDPAEGRFSKYRPDFGIREVRAIHLDNQGGAWIGTDPMGLFYFPDPESDKCIRMSVESGHLVGNRVHGFFEHSDQEISFFVRDGGYYRFGLADGKLAYYGPDIYDANSINSKAIISSCLSSSGFIWLGTYNSGINYLDSRRKNFEHYRMDFSEHGLFNNNVRSLCEDSDGTIWIGTKEEGGISRFDRNSKRFKNYRKSEGPYGLRDDYIFSICELNRNSLLMGTIKEGIAIFDKTTERFEHIRNDPSDAASLASNRVYLTYHDRGGTVWVGTQSVLQVFDPGTRKFSTVQGIPNPKCMTDGNEGTVWVGTRANGVFRVYKANQTMKNYRFSPDDPGTIPSDDIYDLEMDSRGNLWVGTKKGLCRLDTTTGISERFYVKDGLASDWICGLEVDNADNVWVSTVNGISKYDIRQDRFYSYDVRDGLQGNEFEGFVSLKTRDGQLIFGGRNGFNIFFPEQITDNLELPRIALTGLKLFNKEVVVGQKGSPLEKHISQTKELRLKHNQSALTFSYTALNFTSPEKNEYAYRLHGFDDQWIQAGTNRQAVYTNIPPGRYTFQVIGSNNDGYWNTEGVTLALLIAPPWWKTDLAYVVYMLVIFIIFMLVRKMLILRIEQRQLVEFERKDKQRIQELNQQKLRFFTNISHEFRTPLTLITEPLEKLMDYRDDNEERRYLLRVMHNNVKRLLLLINQLIDFRKAEQEKLQIHRSDQDPVEFVNEVIRCFEDTLLRKNIAIVFHHDRIHPGECWFDRDILDKVLFNLMSNAVKYTPRNGRVTIDLETGPETMLLSVSDTGKGIPKEELEHIFERFYQVEGSHQPESIGSGIGLSFARRLVEAHFGSIEVESLLGVGSRFTLHVPISSAPLGETDHLEAGREEIQRTSLLPEPAPLPEQAEDDTGEVSTGTQKLLIVEDNEELIQYLKRSFHGYQVVTAENGMEGYDLAQKEMPDLIISDIMMPEMDGIEMCKKLKEHMATSHIPVVLLTARADIEQKIEGVETGADAYVEKPFDFKYLNSLVKNLLKQRHALRRKYAEDTSIEWNELGVNSQDRKFIDRIHAIVEENIDNPNFSVEVMGAEVGLSRSQLFRKFKSVFDMKPSELIRMERLKKAMTLLATREHNINEVAYLTGFKSASYFITSFKAHYGETPNEFLTKKSGSQAAKKGERHAAG